MNSKMFPSTTVDELDIVLKLLQLSTSNFDSCGGSSGNDSSLLQFLNPRYCNSKSLLMLIGTLLEREAISI
jgi:hypothetical protein